MNKSAMEKRIFVRYCLVSIIVSVINVLFRFNEAVGIFLVVVEIIALFFLAVKRNIASYICYFIIFVCNCMEFSDPTVGTGFVNLKDIRIGGINLAALLLVPLLFISLPRRINIGKIKKSEPHVYKYSIWLLLLNTIALIVGAILVLFNDNQIQRLSPNIWAFFFKESYSVIWIPLVSIVAYFYVLNNQRDRVVLIRIALQATIFGTLAQLIVALLFGQRGYYGGLNTTVVSSAVGVFFPFFILFGVTKRGIVSPRLTAITGAVGTAFVLVFNASGKVVISVFIVSFIFLIQKLRHINKRTIILIVIVLLIIFIVVPIVISNLSESNKLFGIKLNQAIALIRILSPTWRADMPSSPRARVEEIIDVLLEFFNKPFLVFTGKGYLGSMKDWTGFFSTVSQDRQSLFSEVEWENGIFYNLHEVASNLLMFGIMGICFSVSLIKNRLRHHDNNPWTIIGAYWWFLIFGYSFTLGVFGVFSFLYSLSIDDSLIHYGEETYSLKNVCYLHG